ncbi:MAG: Peptidylprolyl isomerase, FKBP-type, partial [uncultured Solirubrobacteraceae bacterium]
DHEREAAGRGPQRPAAVLPARARGHRRRRGRGGRLGPRRRGPLRRRLVEDRPAVRRLVGSWRHLQVRARQGTGHPRLGPGRGGDARRRPAAHHHPAEPRLRQARRRGRHRPGRDARLRRRPRGRRL